MLTGYRIVRDIEGVSNALQVGKRTYPTREAAQVAIRAMPRREASGCVVEAVEG